MEPILGLSVGRRTWVLSGKKIVEGGEISVCQDPFFGRPASKADRLTISHLHGDHSGNANDYAGSTWIAQKAEREWKGAAKSADLSSLSAAPAINVRPAIGGTEIAVRYITNAHDRYEIRAKLNHILVDLLGGKAPAPQVHAVSPSSTETPAVKA